MTGSSEDVLPNAAEAARANAVKAKADHTKAMADQAAKLDSFSKEKKALKKLLKQELKQYILLLVSLMHIILHQQ